MPRSTCAERRTAFTRASHGSTDLNPAMKRLLPLLIPCVLSWAWWHAARLRRTGRPLSPAEREVALAVGVDDPARVRLKFVDRMPLPAERLLSRLAHLTGLPQPRGIDGMTIGHGIYLRRARGESLALLAHELRHVHQYETAGSIAAFVATYLCQVARHGYRDAPFEVDARQLAAHALKVQSPMTAEQVIG